MVLESQQQRTPTTTTEERPSSSYDTMSSIENPPPLALSDIMHPMSPSPVPIEDTPDATTLEFPSSIHRNLFQEPLTDSDVSSIQNRLQEMGVVLSNNSGIGESLSWTINVANTVSSRERELTDMILQLTSCPRIDPAQLQEQATTIALLMTQRDLFMAQVEEERLQWISERESWDRTAEALLTQKTRPVKNEDIDAQRMAYESEIKALRDKLHDRTRRLSALEQEILRLKPLLLMQPYSTSRLKQTIASQVQSAKVQGKRREMDSTPTRFSLLRPIQEDNDSPRKFDLDTYPYGYQYKPEELTLPSSTAPPKNSHPFLFEGPSAPSSSSQRRKSKDHSSNNKTKKQKHQRPASISSDAYAEHVLLAAQKIGRKRAAYVTGLQKLADREREFLDREQEQIQTKKEQERLEKERLERLASGSSSTAYYRPSTTSPQRGLSRSRSTAGNLKTPKRGNYPSHNANPGGVNTPTPSTYVFVNASATPMPKWSGHSPGTMTSTPSYLGVHSSGMRSVHTSLSSNPPTPLDSLVDAARMMGEHGDRSIGRRRPLEEPESPTAKRRKVSADKLLVHRTSSKVGRVRSALDVLADQAAAVNEPGSPAIASQVGGKGKSKAKLPEVQPASRSMRSRGSTKTGQQSTHKRSESPDDTLSAGRGGAKAVQGRLSHSVVPKPRVIARPVATAGQYPFPSQEVGRVGPVMGWGSRPDDEDQEEDDEEGDGEEEQSLHPWYGNTGHEEDSGTRNVDDLVDSHVHPFEAQGDRPISAIESSETTNVHLQTGLVANDDPFAENAARTTLQELYTRGFPRAQIRPLSRQPSRDQSQERPSAHSSPAESRTHKREQGFKPSEGVGTDNDTQVEVDEDEDAEGEEEENNESEADVDSRSPRSRSRSPPPPDPPPPGSDNGPGPDEGHDPDADADAEGEMDVDDNGTPGGGAMISSFHLNQFRTVPQKGVFCLQTLHCSVRVLPPNVCSFIPAICSMIQLLTLSNRCFPFISAVSHSQAFSCTLWWQSLPIEQGIEPLRSGSSLRDGSSCISHAETY